MTRKPFIISALAISACFSARPLAAVPVGLELLLLADVSGSISTAEYNLQKNGYVAAFQQPSIVNKIGTIPNGIAVAYAEWSAANQQSYRVNWSVLTDAASIQTFTDSLAASTRAFSGGTEVDNAITWGAAEILANSYESQFLIMDVSGDGTTNVAATQAARNAAASAGITINGLPIGSQAIINFYADNVITPDGFVEPAADFNDFSLAIAHKLEAEITRATVPEPSSLMLIGGGLACLLLARRRA